MTELRRLKARSVAGDDNNDEQTPFQPHQRRTGAADASADGHSLDGVDYAIRAVGLCMSYRGVDAVRRIDLSVRRGEIFAFLGPNGAGKTTTVEMLEGYRRPTGGSATVLGEDPSKAGAQWRERIGVVLQESAHEPDLHVNECVALYAGYYAHPLGVGETLRLVGLADQAHTLCGHLSGGQKRRLDLGLALIGDPELIFLDEPTTGFDPNARRASWDLIANLRALGKTVFLTTHYMEEAERLADHIAILVGGKIVAEGTPSTLRGRNRELTIIRFRLPLGVAAADLSTICDAEFLSAAGGFFEASVPEPLPVLGALAAWSKRQKAPPEDLEVVRPTLEDVFMRLTTADKEDGR